MAFGIGDVAAIAGAVSDISSVFGGDDDAGDQQRLAYWQQKQFAKKGIRWKVADARAAGIHPLYALNAPTLTPNPIVVGQEDDGFSTALGRVGARLSSYELAKQQERTRSLEERESLARVEQVKAQTDLISVQAAAARAAMLKNGVNSAPHKYIRTWNPFTKKMEWVPNPALGYEYPETLGAAIYARAAVEDEKPSKTAPNYSNMDVSP